MVVVAVVVAVACFFFVVVDVARAVVGRWGGRWEREAAKFTPSRLEPMLKRRDTDKQARHRRRGQAQASRQANSTNTCKHNGMRQ